MPADPNQTTPIAGKSGDAPVSGNPVAQERVAGEPVPASPEADIVLGETLPPQTVRTDDPAAAAGDGASPDTAPAPAHGGISPFARKIAGVFLTRVGIFFLAFITSLLISILLDVDGKGEYSAVTMLPGMLSSLALLGLPNATNYFAGAGRSIASLVRASVFFTAVLSIVVLPIVWFALPALETSVLKGAPDDLLRVILITLPLGMLASFGGTILYGRQDVRVYNVILLAQAALTLLSAVVLLGVFHLGVPGAVAGTIGVSLFLVVAVTAQVWRLGRRDKRGEPVSFRGLTSYGLRVYPASITGYFNYRADTYLIQAFAISKSVAERNLGLYSQAVTMAELVFYIPDSVTTIFLPRVAGATKEDADRMLGRVSRLTVLITLLVAIALIPAAYLGVHIVLRSFAGCLPAFYAILPGVVTLSSAKVTTSYVNGRGRPGPVSLASGLALVLNIAANIVLIPALGIVGASLSSVVSYTALAAMMLVVASRMSGQSKLSLIIPTRAEFDLLWTGSMGALRRASARTGLAARFAR